MSVDLWYPATGPFDPGSLLDWIVSHAVPGLDRTEATTRTTVRLVDVGRQVPVEAALGADGVRVRAEELLPGERRRLDVIVRRWFDLERDPRDLDGPLAGDPLLAPCVRARPGLRVAVHPDGWQAALQTVIGQQVSLAAARTLTGRLVAAFGSDGPSGLRLAPTPEVLLAAGEDVVRVAVGLTSARARTLLGLARACADGVRLVPGEDERAVRQRLLAVPGIGPWTVDHLALRALGEPDVFPSSDLVLRRTAGVDDARALARRAEQWSPARSRAAAHLWAAALSARRARAGSGTRDRRAAGRR